MVRAEDRTDEVGVLACEVGKVSVEAKETSSVLD